MKFPYYQQLDKMGCGPACIRMIAKYYGKAYSLNFLRKQSNISREGVSMFGIIKTAESIGMRAIGVELTWEQLQKETDLPCIMHWNRNHFVVVYRVDKMVHVADPAHGLIRYKPEEFQKRWLNGRSAGHVILLEPNAAFYEMPEPPGEKVSSKFLWKYFRPYYGYLLKLALAALVGSLLSLTFPLLTQSIVDIGIADSNLSFIIMVLVAQMTLTFGQTANGLIKNWLMLHVTTRISISLVSGFLSKLMRLPISFFDVKMIGDIIQRIGDHNRIQTFFTGSLINIFFSMFTLVMYSIIMASYHLGILMIFYVCSTLYILWIVLFLRKQRELDYKRFSESAHNQGNMVELITGMQEIKLNNSERKKRWEWERIQVNLFRVQEKVMVLEQNQQLGATFIEQVKNILISFLSAKAVIDGDMTLGMMMAVQYIIGQLNAPIQQLTAFTRAAQDARISLERLGEIHNMKDEEEQEDDRIPVVPRNEGITINDLSFSYAGSENEVVLDHVTLNIPANQVTAIVGMSGSGKSTLIKLLLGFYESHSGETLLGETPLMRYKQSEWRKHVGVVMQESFIFSDTIANNVSMIDDTPDWQRIEHATSVANIREFIETLPLKYDTRIGNNGHGLSAGQKQRILIARAVYKDPAYLFFDEATNSLDANNERIIMDNLRQFFRGRTVILIAHRLSTVRNADQIVMLNAGTIAEIGTHEILLQKRGMYYQLVQDQLA